MVRKGEFTDSQIILALRQREQALKAMDLYRKLEITVQALQRWKRLYAGLEISDLKELRILNGENQCLKSIVADLTLDK